MNTKHDLAVLVTVVSLIVLSLYFAPDLDADTFTATPTATVQPETLTSLGNGSAGAKSGPSPTPVHSASSIPTPTITLLPTPTITPTPSSTTKPSPTPTGSPSPTSTPTPTPEEWPKAEFWHECDARTSADIYYRVEVLGTQRVTELYGSDKWETNFPRTFRVSTTETYERSMDLRGGRWIELYSGENAEGDPFAQYQVEEDACAGYSG